MGLITGFVGIEAYDLIHYLSRMARVLGKKSLMIDLSENKALGHSIRNPLVPDGELVDFRGVDFISDKVDQGALERYDYVFIDFGRKTNHPALSVCDGIFCVLDLQRHNAAKLRELRIENDQFVCAVFRNVIQSKVKPEVVLSQIPNLEIAKENLYEIMQADSNTLAALNVQYDSGVRFDKITGDFKMLLFDFFSDDYKESEIKSAFKKASRTK